MTGTTTGQTTLATATDSDDTEAFLTGPLTTDLQALANLFESATGHDHTGAGKGKPIGSAGIASGITLTAPHMTSPVVDSGGLTVTAGGLTVTAGGEVITAGGLTVTAGGIGVGIAVGGPGILLGSAASAPSTVAGQVGIGSGTVGTATAGANGAPPAQVAGYMVWNINGAAAKVPYYAS